MKVFRVWVDDYDYDEYDSFVVVAESEEEIRKRFKYDENAGYWRRYEYSIGEKRIRFAESQVETLADIHIEEVDLTKESIVCASYNAG